MTNNTRRTIVLAAGAAALASLPLAGGAQPAGQGTAPREGRDYRLVKPAQATEVPEGKIEVIEFFWYGCPHCYSLEPIINDWVRRLPDDVVFRRVHVPFGDRNHQQLFYTLRAMGKADEAGEAVFRAIHVERNRLDNVDKMAEVLAKHGVDEARFRDTFKSFAVRTDMRRAAKTVDAYAVDSVPALAVNGKYYTSPSMAGSNQAAVRLLDQLVALERGGQK
jgi:thiol:disulfide interchange protein DsbA